MPKAGLVAKPYGERSDREKIQSQWNKLSGLHSREEWSAAVVRAATVAEIAANFAIRKEFADRSKLPAEFVNKMLLMANGLSGKVDRLLVPLVDADAHKREAVAGLRKKSEKINVKRNSVVHQGEFCNPEEAQTAIRQAKEFVEGLMRIYDAGFVLADKQAPHRID